MPVLELKDLNVFYGNIHAIKDVSLEVNEGEIVSLIGTLDAEGEHLHLAVSDENGHMSGGHMMPGCTVRTTLELVIGELENVQFTREHCPLSGYEELVITER